MKYTHVVFDVDGTLINTAENLLISLRDALKETDGFSYTTGDLEFSLACPSLVTLDRLGVKDSQATLALWIENEKKYVDLFHIFDGVTELLDHLVRSGRRLGIVTSRSREELSLIFDALPLRQYFDTVICSDDVENPKPAPDPLLRYMELTGAARNDILFVGDTLHDMHCASHACISSALAVWGTRENVKEVPADHYPGTPAELKHLLA